MADSQGGGKKKKKKTDSTPVMEGQTEEERRILRQEQRALLDRMGDRQQDMAQLDSAAFAECRENNNHLFKKVRFTREMGNDGDNMVAISEAAVKRSAQLAHSVSQYSATSILTELGQRYGARGTFDWTKFGEDVAPCFRTVPQMTFLCGPLQKPVEAAKERKKAAPRKKASDNDVEEGDTQYETTDGMKQAGDEKEEATNARLGKLTTVMDTEMSAKGGDGAKLDLMQLLVNPDSFCETVENFFDLSFLVKDGKAALEIDPASGLATARLSDPPDNVVPKTQNVVVLSMANVQDIAKLWNIKKTTLSRQDDDDDDAE